jgi:hypothetical protein
MLTAEEARQLQKEQILLNLDKRIQNQINTSTDNHIYLSDIDDFARQSLQERGFKVEFETDSYKVSW